MKQVLRREVKYILGIEEYYKYSRYFAKFLNHDIHNGSNGYMVRSLYFDTLDDTDFFEKESGVDPRRKVRLRLYNTDSQIVQLEMKQKQGDQQRKRILSLKREDAAELIRGEYSGLLSHNDPFAAECYGLIKTRCYRPDTVVQYTREAYLASENDIRITFDRDIRANNSCFDIFSDSLCLSPILDLYAVVLEVKYNGFLPNYIKDLLDSVDKRSISAGKYVMGHY